MLDSAPVPVPPPCPTAPLPDPPSSTFAGVSPLRALGVSPQTAVGEFATQTGHGGELVTPSAARDFPASSPIRHAPGLPLQRPDLAP